MNTPTLTDAVAIVSGGSRGLGLLIATELAQHGYNLALIARTRQEVEKTADKLQADFPSLTIQSYPADVGDQASIKDIVQAIEDSIGPVEVLLNVAGIIHVGPLENTTEELFEQTISSMVLGPINLTLSVLPFMRQRRTGHIGTVSSIGGAIAVPHLLPYSVAKFGSRGFSEGLTSELVGTGITATTIMPGLMRTGSHQRAQFIGERDKEYAWFAPSASLPGISMNADKAAQRIVSGTLAGKSHIILTPFAKAGLLVHGLSPQVMVKTMGVVARLLPVASPESDASDPQEGRALGGLKKSLPVKVLTALGDKASKKNREHPSH